MSMRIVKKNSAAAGKAAGEKAGWREGWMRGNHLGRCEAVRARYLPAVPPPKALKLLYIPQGFPAIDQGIIRALRSSVSELNIGSPPEMLAATERHRPDLMLVLNGLHGFPPDHLQQIEAIRAMGIRTVIWFVDDPYFTDWSAIIAPHYDVVLTYEQSCVPFYSELGCSHVAYLPLAADPDLFRPQQVEPMYRSDICFIGMGFWNRIAVFDKIASYLAAKKVVIAGGLWKRMSKFHLLRSSVREGWVPIEEVAKYYSGAKIVLNIHRGHSNENDNLNSRKIPGISVNPRTFEMAACGSLQLTDLRDDLPRLYTPGREIAVYQTPAELVHKLEYYLTHDKQREAAACRGLRRTLQQHSYVTRIGQLLQLLGY